jgi:hypothetical protein
LKACPRACREILLSSTLGGVKTKIRRVAETLAAAISRWENVEAILLGEATDIEVYDPYFIVDLDVYIQGPVPPAAERKERLAETAAVESAGAAGADRLTLEDIPVVIHYLETQAVDGLVRRILDSSWVFHEPGTNMFYRIEKGEVLYSRGGWLASIRASHAEVPDGFWSHIRAKSLGMAEKALSDLGAASYHSDELFFLMAAARLLRAVGGYLFAVNRQFEPSGRMLAKRLKALPVLPDGFIGQLETFLRQEDKLSFEAKREISAHMVRDLAALRPEPRNGGGGDRENSLSAPASVKGDHAAKSPRTKRASAKPRASRKPHTRGNRRK